MSASPLDGVRVLDLSRVLAGPWAMQLLADWGADVVKVERPGAGDDTRHWGPPWHEGPHERVAAYFLAANRGKRSIAIDLAHPDGAALILRMALASDVVVENFKVGGLRRHGLDADALRAAKPELIVASITGFGQDGPSAGEAGYDFAIQARGGLMSVTGEADGGPLRAGVAVADIFTGLYAANAILAALLRRWATGLGAHLDIALLDVQAAVLANQALNYLVSGESPPRQGNTHPNIVPYQSFAVADGEIVVAVGNDAQFRRLAALAGADWADDERFASNAARVANRSALVPLIAARMLTRPAADWLHAFGAAGIPCAPINDIAAVFADPQVQHRGVRIETDSPVYGATPGLAAPVRLDGVAPRSPRPQPGLGEHGRELLIEYGLGDDEIGALVARGAVQLAGNSGSL